MSDKRRAAQSAWADDRKCLFYGLVNPCDLCCSDTCAFGTGRRRHTTPRTSRTDRGAWERSGWIHPKSNALSALLPALIPVVIAKQRPACPREGADAEPRSTTPEPESSSASPSSGRAPR